MAMKNSTKKEKSITTGDQSQPDSKKKKFKFDVHGIRFSVWSAFMIFTLILLCFLWCTEFIFLRIYYTKWRENEIVKNGTQLAAAYNGYNYKTAFDDFAEETDLSIIILTLEGTRYKISYFSDFSFYDITESGFVYLGVDSGAFVEKIKKEGSLTETGTNGALLYGHDLGNGNYLICSYNSNQIKSASNILENQLWIYTAMAILLALLLSFMISGIITKDMTGLYRSAKELAKGKTDTVFEVAGFTETKEIATTLNFATAEINKTEKLRRELIANVSHDLRTPLTIIKGYAELIKDISGDNPEKRNAQLDSIIVETDRLTTLVRDMLNLSQMESGATEFQKEVFSLSDTINKIADSFLVFEEKNGYRFIRNIAPDLFVFGDRTRLELVVYNLVSNAVNYTGEDKTIYLNLTLEDEKVRFVVKDTGVGMDEEQISMVWQRYYRAKEHKRAVVGSGLGLSIVRAILDAHQDCNYGVNSKKGEGSEFFFTLPQVNIEK